MSQPRVQANCALSCLSLFMMFKSPWFKTSVESELAPWYASLPVQYDRAKNTHEAREALDRSPFVDYD